MMHNSNILQLALAMAQRDVADGIPRGVALDRAAVAFGLTPSQRHAVRRQLLDNKTPRGIGGS